MKCQVFSVKGWAGKVKKIALCQKNVSLDILFLKYYGKGPIWIMNSTLLYTYVSSAEGGGARYAVAITRSLFV